MSSLFENHEGQAPGAEPSAFYPGDLDEVAAKVDRDFPGMRQAFMAALDYDGPRVGPVTRYTGDEGRDRLRNPSINAPHTKAEARLAVLHSARKKIVDLQTAPWANPHDFGPDSVTRRTEQQAAWLDEATKQELDNVLQFIDQRIGQFIAEAEDDTPYGKFGDHCPWCGADWKRPHTEDCTRPEDQ